MLAATDAPSNERFLGCVPINFVFSGDATDASLLLVTMSRFKYGWLLERLTRHE